MNFRKPEKNFSSKIDFIALWQKYRPQIAFFTVLWLFTVFDQLCWFSDLRIFTFDRYWKIFSRSVGFALIFFLLFINLPRKIKWTAAAGMMLFFAINVIQFWCQRSFAMLLDGDLIFILSQNNYEICRDFCRSHLTRQTLIFFLLYGAGCRLLIHAFHKLNRPVSWKRSLVSLILFVGILWTIHVFSSLKLMIQRSAAGYFCMDMFHIGRTYRNFAKAMNSPVLPKHISCQLTKGETSQQGIGVIVIGDAASRNYMSLYGYSRKTTPELDRLKNSLYVFTNCQTISGGTGISLRHIATQKLFANNTTADLCSFVDIYRAAGWRVILLSTPPRWGRWETVEGLLFAHADKKIYAPEVIGAVWDDHQLLPFFDRESADCKTPTLFVFHLIGSHTPFRKQYPHGFQSFDNLVDDANRPYPPELQTRINRYCNSLLWTDIFLGKILEKLRDKPLPAFFLYVSDHGESVKAPEIRRMDEKDTIMIPLVMWFSEEYRKRFPERLAYVEKNLNAPVEIDRLFWSIVYMGTISYDQFPEEHNLFSAKYKPSKFHFFNPEKTIQTARH